MKLLIDMNLSPEWVKALAAAGFPTVHWSSVGAPNAQDSEIFKYAADNDFVVFTHDLDFGTLLAHAKSHRPSVVQARVQDVTPAALGATVAAAIKQFAQQLDDGALVTILPDRAKVRILPI